MSHRLVLAAASAGLVLAGSAYAARAPHVGQFCSLKKTAPTGFKCVAGPTGRGVLTKA